MKAKETTKKTAKAPVAVKDIAPKADPKGGHHHPKQLEAEKNNQTAGKSIRRAS